METENTKQLEQIQSEALGKLDTINNLKELENWRVAYLGRKGALTQMLRGLSQLPVEERREVGSKANQLKSLLQEKFSEKEESLKQAELERKLEESRIDVTLPGYPIQLGRTHPTTKILRRACNIFASMGFEIIEGPEVEWDSYNFEALNMPKGHPARDMWDTLWIDYTDENGERPMLLRTHTSPMEIRFMERRDPPIRAIMPGKCYRYEATDTTHESMFYQIEGLAVDKGITMADLKGTLYEFARKLFGEERKIRFRCDYFPFVEPGVEVAIDCFICHGEGCSVCGGDGWIEILGAGMSHPDVLRWVGYDPDVYTGFAFGIGLERIPMLMYGINDIRLFYNNDVRFLQQF
ncbi:MAG: phenylalanine--tRNA ligase subunit alpha [Dehalococcoidia bacterium]